MMPLILAAGRSTKSSSNSTYQSLVLTSSPYAYYPLTETSGTVANDISGNGRNGTYEGTYTLASKTLYNKNKYLSLPGSDTSYVDISSAYEFGSGTAWTFECWCNVAAWEGNANTDYASVSFISNTAGVPSTGFNIFNDSSNVGMGYWPASYRDAYWKTGISLNTNSHVVFTYNNGTVACYLNGTALTFDYVYLGNTSTSTSASSAVNMHTNGDLYIGKEAVLGGPLSGVIGEVALYTTALSSATITSHYNTGISVL
jgi:hypothetical protein